MQITPVATGLEGVQDLVNLEVQLLQQAQRLMNLEVQISCPSNATALSQPGLLVVRLRRVDVDLSCN